MKQGTIFTDDRGDGGVAEAARFVGLWAGCVPRSKEWNTLVKTVPGYLDMGDDDLVQAYADALALLTRRS